MNLARKFRPKVFAEVVGQEYVIKAIKNSLIKDNISHAFLFCGSRGTGKTTMARLIAKSLNCENLQNGDPCNECGMCQAATEDRLVDLIEIDAASNRGIDEIRDLKEKIGFSPTMGKRKIYIIDEVHMLTKEAFNALLKTLEEPPEHVFFILATTERHKIPETIQSRCQVFAFQQFTKEQIAGRLQEIAEREGIDFDREALLTIASEAAGGMRDAIFLLEQHSTGGSLKTKDLEKELGITANTALEQFYELISNAEMSKAVDLIAELASEGFSLTNFSKNFLGFLREKMLTEITKKEQPQLKHLLNLINIFSTAHLELKNAVIPSLPLEVAVVKSAQLKQGIETDTSSWFSFGNKKSEKKDNPNPPKEPAKAVNETSSASKEQKEVEAHESSEVKKAVYTAPELNLDSVTTAYSKIIDKVPTFSIKMALKQSRPDFVDQKKVILAFNSESMRSKVETASGRNEVAKAFEEVFLRPLMIETKIDDITLRPVSEEGQDVGSDEKLSGKDLEDAVKEIFGTSNGS